MSDVLGEHMQCPGMRRRLRAPELKRPLKLSEANLHLRANGEDIREGATRIAESVQQSLDPRRYHEGADQGEQRGLQPL